MTISRIVLVLIFLGVTIPAWCQAQLGDRLRSSGPVYCEANDDVEIRGRVIETGGNGIEVHGNCDVEIIDSRIVAGGIGILVQNNGSVEIKNSYIEGAVGGLVVENNGEASYRNSTIRGGIRRSGLGELYDEGGNEIEGLATHGTSTRAIVSPGTVQVGDIVVTEDGVVVGSGADAVEITEGRIRTGTGDEVTIYNDDSVVVESGGTRVITEGDYVRIDDRGSSTTIVSNWRERGSSKYSSADTDEILVELGARTHGLDVELNLAGDVLFDFDSSAVRPQAASQLRKLAHVLRDRSGGRIYVTGHTDSVGSNAYNQKLSEARAVAVMRWLNDNEGIPLELMRGQGMGGKKPIAHNTRPDGSDDPAGRAKNRRVEVRFSSS